MICPKCGAQTIVVEVENNPDANVTMRRRRCRKCKYVFHTCEEVVGYTDGFAEDWSYYRNLRIKKERMKNDGNKE